MFWSLDSCQNRVSADKYHQTVSRAQVSTHRVRLFLKLFAKELLVFKWSQAQVYFFNSWETCCVYVPHNENFDFKLTSDAKNQPAITGRKDSCFWLFLPWSRSASNFYALIGQNLTGEFMRKIYAASWNLFTLTAEADGVLCQLEMFLTFFFHWMYKMIFSCYQESCVIPG